MGSAKAKDVDEYIARASERNRPILEELRRVFRGASPKLREEIKWGLPWYTYEGPVGGFAAYQKHVSWGLWKARLVKDPDGILGKRVVMGGRIATMAEFPPAAKLAGLIRQGVALNEAGVKNPKPPEPQVPADFAAALKKGGGVKHFAGFTPARKWQYLNWINQAKRPETRTKRIAIAVGRIGEGKPMK